ncbi:MAG: histone-like protein [Promethearchaeota archaeon]
MAKKAKVEPLFVKSKVREYIKSKGLNTASAVLDGDALNKIIIEMLDKAVERAKANNRKTVKARDL